MSRKARKAGRRVSKRFVDRCGSLATVTTPSLFKHIDELKRFLRQAGKYGHQDIYIQTFDWMLRCVVLLVRGTHIGVLETLPLVRCICSCRVALKHIKRRFYFGLGKDPSKAFDLVC